MLSQKLPPYTHGLCNQSLTKHFESSLIKQVFIIIIFIKRRGATIAQEMIYTFLNKYILNSYNYE